MDDKPPHWDRLKWDVTHLFSKKPNPYLLDGEPKDDGSEGLLPVSRPAWKDLTEAVVNIWVHYFPKKGKK